MPKAWQTATRPCSMEAGERRKADDVAGGVNRSAPGLVVLVDVDLTPLGRPILETHELDTSAVGVAAATGCEQDAVYESSSPEPAHLRAIRLNALTLATSAFNEQLYTELHHLLLERW